MNEAEFKAAYKALIETVREKNGEDCKIVCLYNTMNDTYSSSIIEICRELGGQPEGIYYYMLDRADSGHPTAEENRAYLSVLKDVVKDALDGVVTERYLGTDENGDGMSMDFENDMKPHK